MAGDANLALNRDASSEWVLLRMLVAETCIPYKQLTPNQLLYCLFPDRLILDAKTVTQDVTMLITDLVTRVDYSSPRYLTFPGTSNHTALTLCIINNMDAHIAKRCVMHTADMRGPQLSCKQQVAQQTSTRRASEICPRSTALCNLS